MVCRINITYNRIEDKQDVKKIHAWYKSFCWPLGIYEVGKNDNTLKSVLSENMTIDILANDDSMKSVMTIHSAEDEMLFLNERCFLKIKVGCTKLNMVCKYTQVKTSWYQLNWGTSYKMRL